MAYPSSFHGKDDDDLEAGNYYVVEEGKYLGLYRATVQGNWNEAQKFLNLHDNDNKHKNIVVVPLNNNLDTVLHVAARRHASFSFVEKVVAKLGADDDEALLLRNRKGLAPLHLAARYGNIDVAKLLVRRNSSLLYNTSADGLFPIHYAARNTLNKVEVYRYFLGVTKDNGQANPYQGPSGATILVSLIKSKFYVVATELADKYPDLTLHHQTLDEDTSPLEAIVKYDYPIFNKANTWLWLTSRTYALLSTVNMLKHKQAVELLKCLCDKLKILNDTEVASIFKKALIEAAYLDIEEVVQNIVEAYPMTAYYQDKSGRNILHIAVENRCINVFNLVCGPGRTSVLMHDLVDERDKSGNNILHLAGKLAPPHKLNLVSVAPLQMQQELQWFKAVKDIAPPYFSSLKNKDNKTAEMVFRDEHKALKERAEKWMKETATSCSIVAALIVTVMFAATITVPGGSHGDDDHSKEGTPIFSQKTAFTFFYFSNGVSLFTSVTCLLLFLSVLTSRFNEEDFLYALPMRLNMTLLTLFISVIYMMVAFSSTVFLVFRNGKYDGDVVAVFLVVVSCVPVVIFLLRQSSLLVAFLSSSTNRWRIFKKHAIPQMAF